MLSSRSLFLGAAVDVFQAGLALDDESERGERRNDYINNDNNNDDDNDDDIYGNMKSKIYGNIESRSMVIGDNTNYKEGNNKK